MKTQTDTDRAALNRRIKPFYTALGQREYAKCYAMIDPRLLAKPGTVTLFQYTATLRAFLDAVGRVSLQTVRVTGLHLNEPNKLYEGRDFAVGKTTWLDGAGEPHEFAERWVPEGTKWYTRSTGLLAPAPATVPRKLEGASAPPLKISRLRAAKTRSNKSTP